MAKPVINGKERDWEKGDVVQITTENHHWFPALIIVSEPKPFGVQGYTVIVNNSEEDNGLAYIRLNHDDIELVGTAVLVRKDFEE